MNEQEMARRILQRITGTPSPDLTAFCVRTGATVPLVHGRLAGPIIGVLDASEVDELRALIGPQQVILLPAVQDE